VGEHNPPLQVLPAPQACPQAPQLAESVSSEVEQGMARSFGPFIFALDEQPSTADTIQIARRMGPPAFHRICDRARIPDPRWVVR
jgi:hypothetical protein